MRSDIPSACTKSIYIWKSPQKARPPVRSTLMFGWEDEGGLVPVFFWGQMSSDFLQDLMCSAVAKANQFVPVAVFVLNRFCRAQIFVLVMVATYVKMP